MASQRPFSYRDLLDSFRFRAKGGYSTEEKLCYNRLFLCEKLGKYQVRKVTGKCTFWFYFCENDYITGIRRL